MPHPGPTLKQLKDRLQRLLTSAIAFSGVAYRSSTPEYATEDELLTGEGSKLHGGRWNPIGIAVVYASLTPETAMGETLAHNRYYGISVEDAMPRTFVAIAAKMHAVLDFRDGSVRRKLQVSQKRILAVDWRKDVRAGREPLTDKVPLRPAGKALLYRRPFIRTGTTCWFFRTSWIRRASSRFCMRIG